MSSLRPDRLLTLGWFHPLRRAGLSAGKCGVPVLMYHSIADEAEADVSPYYRTTTSPARFAEQLAWLQADGWRVVSLKTGLELLGRPQTAGDKFVALTFDDGFRDFHTAAFPILRRFGAGATMFLPTAFVGDEPRRFKGRECLTWSEVRELHQAGIEFGSHTVNHPKLYELGFAQIRAELENSKAVLEEQLGGPVESFAYPYAFPSADHPFVETFVKLLQDAGYACNATTRIGRVRAGDDVFTLKRLPVNSADDAALFQAKLAGAYDWLNWPQDALKRLKRFTGNGSAKREAVELGANP